MVARLKPTVRLKVHEAVRLAMDRGRPHSFDPKTEAAI